MMLILSMKTSKVLISTVGVVLIILILFLLYSISNERIGTMATDGDDSYLKTRIDAFALSAELYLANNGNFSDVCSMRDNVTEINCIDSADRYRVSTKLNSGEYYCVSIYNKNPELSQRGLFVGPVSRFDCGEKIVLSVSENPEGLSTEEWFKEMRREAFSTGTFTGLCDRIINNNVKCQADKNNFLITGKIEYKHDMYMCIDSNGSIEYKNTPFSVDVFCDDQRGKTIF